MFDILARLSFVVWIISGGLTIAFGLAGWNEPAITAGMVFFFPIVLGLIYVVIRWIFTGESD
jgi:hypothetical protein